MNSELRIWLPGLMSLPIEPSKDDCCGSGCNPCILDVYENQVKKYKAGFKTEQQNIIQLTSFTSFNLLGSIKLNNCCKLLRFSKTGAAIKHLYWKPGQHFLLKYVQEDGRKSTRAYSPMKIPNCTETSEFQIIVKVYPNGNCSRYLHNLPTGAECLWRGPYGDYRRNFSSNRVIIIAQGVALTAFHTFVESILDDAEDEARLILFYCIKRLSEIILRDVLFQWSQFWNFDYYILAKEVDENIKYQEPVFSLKFSVNFLLNKLETFTQTDEFFICGSKMFIEGITQDLINCGIPKGLIQSFQ